MSIQILPLPPFRQLLDLLHVLRTLKANNTSCTLIKYRNSQGRMTNTKFALTLLLENKWVGWARETYIQSS